MHVEKRFHNFYTKINDQGVPWGDTGRILAQWQHPVAFRVALDLPYWVMRSASYRLIRMAIQMALEAGALFSDIDLRHA